MLPVLQSGFDAIEAQKSEILARVSGLTGPAQDKSPKPGDWSPHEIVHHIVIAEELVLGQIEALQTAGVDKRRALPAPFLALLTKILGSGIRVPAPLEMIPQGAVPLPKLMADWDAQRGVFAVRLEGVTEETRREPFALHPIAGPLDARQVLALAHAHQKYHLRQIRRLCQVA